MDCASVRFASRLGGGRSVRPHRCASSLKCRTTTRPFARRAASTRRNSTRTQTPRAHNCVALAR
eukprot:5389198-Lingulodinium_polyedra.AAC.1